VAELRAFASRFGDGGDVHPMPLRSHADWPSRPVSWTNVDQTGEAVAN
jgi:hypothetical protein